MITTRLAALLFILLGLGSRAQQAGRDVLPSPDPALQSGIARLLEAGSEEELRSSLDALRRMAGAEHELLVPQLFLFTHKATDTREAMVFGFAIAALPIPPEHVVRALMPLLESPDRALRQALDGVLSEYEDRSIDRGASFSIYRAFLERPEGELSLGLVRHLVETDPGAALLALARAQVSDPSELRSLLWAEHEVADVLWKLRFGFVEREELASRAPEALAQLDFLSRHPRWWARLCAAEVAGLEPALRSAARMEELGRDDHPLVRDAALAVR